MEIYFKFIIYYKLVEEDVSSKDSKLGKGVLEYKKMMNLHSYWIKDKNYIKKNKKLKTIEKLSLIIIDYIKSITSKIKKIKNFDVVMKLINIITLKLNYKDKYLLIFLVV